MAAEMGEEEGKIDIQSAHGTGKLISLMEKEQCLWDFLSPDYYKREKRQEAELRVAGEFGVDVKTIKSRWHNIRSYYSKELRRIKETEKNGADTHDIRRPKWPFYSMVDAFLRPTIMPRRMKPNLDDITADESADEGSMQDEVEEDGSDGDLASQGSTPIELPAEPAPKSQGSTPTELPAEPAPKSQGSTPTELHAEPAPKRKATGALKPRDEKSNPRRMDDLISVASQALKCITNDNDDDEKPAETEDEAAIFGKMVASGMRRITSRLSREQTKLKILNLIFAAEFGLYQPQGGHPMAHDQPFYQMQPSYQLAQFPAMPHISPPSSSTHTSTSAAASGMDLRTLRQK